MAEQTSAKTSKIPVWAAPVAIAVVIVALIAGSRKNSDLVENPLVDLAILTIGVFAFAAGFRFIGTKLNAPGMATFFGAPVAVSSGTAAY
jgi:hypothetical protein